MESRRRHRRCGRHRRDRRRGIGAVASARRPPALGSRHGNTRDQPPPRRGRPNGRLPARAAGKADAARRPAAESGVGRCDAIAADRDRSTRRVGFVQSAVGQGRGLDCARQLAGDRGRAFRTTAMAIRAGRPRPARDRAESLSVRGHACPQRQRAERHGARPGRDLREGARPHPAGAAGLLDRHHRGHQPAVQGVRRRRRLRQPELLARTVPQPTDAR